MRDHQLAHREAWSTKKNIFGLEQGKNSEMIASNKLAHLLYDGSGDPYDHMAAYKQAVHAEEVEDTHTQIEGFGLTLESKALTWFQTLGLESKASFYRA